MFPTVVELAEEPPSLAQLAQRHRLKPAGTRPTFGAYLANLWRFRAFIAAYANGRLIASFGTARLGRLWQVLTPLINAAVYYLIFGVILDTRRDVDNFIAYLCAGLFVFGFTQTVLQAGGPVDQRATSGWSGRCSSPGPACPSP